MAEGSEVTFVGGKAIEQSEPLESNLDNDSREAAKSAVREAMQKAGRDSVEEAKRSSGDPFSVNPERKAPKESAPTKEDEAPSDEPIDFDKASVKQILKARERVASMKRDATDEISRARQEFDSQRAQFQQEQQQYQYQLHQLQRDREALHALKNDPGRAMRELGMDPEKWILDLAKEGTPEGQQERQRRELESRLNEMTKWRADQEKLAEEQRYNAQVQHIQQYREAATKAFTTMGMNEDKYPHVSNFYKGNERGLVAIGDLTAEEYRSLSGGKEGSFEDILDYLEEDLADRAKSWYSKNSGVQKVSTPSIQVKPTKGSKGKTLSPDVSGERRTLQPKDLAGLSDAERHEAAKQAVAVALAASRE